MKIDALHNNVDFNCHGCKWLDETATRIQDQHGNDKLKRIGAGYCCKVNQSLNFSHGDRVRTVYTQRCELYEEGKFERRYEND